MHLFSLTQVIDLARSLCLSLYTFSSHLYSQMHEMGKAAGNWRKGQLKASNHSWILVSWQELCGRFNHENFKSKPITGIVWVGEVGSSVPTSSEEGLHFTCPFNVKDHDKISCTCTLVAIWSKLLLGCVVVACYCPETDGWDGGEPVKEQGIKPVDVGRLDMLGFSRDAKRVPLL